MLLPALFSSMSLRIAFSICVRKSWLALLVRSSALTISAEGMEILRDFVSGGSMFEASSAANFAVIGSKSSGMVKFSAPVRIICEASITGGTNS